MLLHHDIIIYYAIYIDIVTIRSFVINIFVFLFGGLNQAVKIQTTPP